MLTDTITTSELFVALDKVTDELTALLSASDKKIINTVPFKSSWTPAQLAVHVTKSNNAIVQGLGMAGKSSERDAEENVPQLKKIFLDFKAKYQSPEFIVPEERMYNKEEVISALKKSIEQLQQLRSKTKLDEIINLPIFGEITKLELLHFVLYHTQRHVHQLKNILSAINNNKLHVSNID
jgi:hypothetical protein